MYPKVYCLMGPTASGKSALALKIAEKLPCDIISVDSALVYYGMDIGTAKPTLAERAIVPHHLIDIRDPANPYSAADFVKDVKVAINDCLSRQRIPLLVGGTMLYFKALQQGLATLPSADPTIRAQLAKQFANEGLASLYATLQKCDPQSAVRINSNDPQRILRALEVFLISGKKLSQHWAEQKTEQSYQFINIVFRPSDRKVLHQRIADRFEEMLNKGLIDEVARLRIREDLHAELPAMRAVGYRQVWQYLAGELQYQEMTARGIIATRQLAKRQLTWLRQWPAVQWLDSEDPKALSQCLCCFDNNNK